MKKIVCLVLSLTLILIGCTSKPQSSVPIADEVTSRENGAPAKLSDPEPAETQVQAPKQTWLPAPGKFPLTKDGVTVLYYHAIANLPGNELGVTPEKFAAQMKFLADSGYNTIAPDQLYAAYQGQAILPAKPLMLTFDDGYLDNYTAAFPILKQYNFTATFFVITDIVGQGMMSWEQLKEMQDYGMTIMPHSASHPKLGTLRPEEQRKELANSKTVLEKNLGIQAKYFCYPYGSYNNTTLKLLKELDYKLAFSTERGRAKPGDNLLLVKRLYVNGFHDLETFQQRLVAY